ncbi:ABC-F family ATP-binding cassette domain-containing protein [Leptonema illini]|uniref:Probable ATP-binding protein YbiT n=1 Tax=Leptonema illini DSM 21528 TaxID=929563 RepID=H2CKD5_9LEPT|nr:ATP-binding cassette domain-containing protein [Leptonema illini]EHQ08240.1 ABC transporter related protein [Leptonema illini DSM 21528]
MIRTNNISLAYGGRKLFQDVTVSFNPGNCYGLIGANGAGKSTFMKILAGEIQADSGEVIVGKNERVAMLRQDQFAFDDYTVLDTVIVGHRHLYDVMKEREAIYAKESMTDEEGMRVGELEEEFAEMNGYEAETEAASLLEKLGIGDDMLYTEMKNLEAGLKIRVLLAQALFGNPDVLLLDEPTNNLDLKTTAWLENFLSNFENTVVVISHDRHFLNSVCTHIADLDFGKIQVYTGNYDFWYHASQLAAQQRKTAEKKAQEKIAELQAFIQRFSAHKAKSKQASSRRKLIDKLTPEEMPQSSRKTPYIHFKAERKCGDQILETEDLTVAVDGENVIEKFSFRVNHGERIALLGKSVTRTAFFQTIVEEIKPVSGSFRWGQTIKYAYLPADNESYFTENKSILDWLREVAGRDDTQELRGFLGRMLFSGEEVNKKVGVLSGGERQRCVLSRIMMTGANVLLLDEPTNHLDLESIQALNDGVLDFPEVVIFTSHDHEFVSTVANRIIEFTPGGVIDRSMSFDEYMDDTNVQELRDKLYKGHVELQL